ncbi:MAG: DmsE family decaheme c-type cytochrome [Betaproteobacteria bacterium]|jgi:DmsE family decaheme c-type cytochrome
MRIRSALAAIGFGLLAFGLGGAPSTAHAMRDAEASKICLKCHSEAQEKYARSPHAVAADPRTPSCVSCHGPSKLHAEKMGAEPPDVNFDGAKAVDAQAASAVCLSCHEKGVKQALWSTSRHPEAAVSCSGCHQVHVNKDRVIAKTSQAEVCYACHKAQRHRVDLPSRHPIAEGKMSCSDCHNVHGSVGPKLVKKDSTNATCFTCHAEKRGPFVYQHQPVTEDCSICHNPHGSTVSGMLKVRAPMLCNQCHTPHVSSNVPALGGQRGVFPPPAPGQGAAAIGPTTNAKNPVNMTQGRSCMNCHTQVHGSNNPSTANPTPQSMFR